MHHPLRLGQIAGGETSKGLVQQLLLFVAQSQFQMVAQQPLGKNAVLPCHKSGIEGFKRQFNRPQAGQQINRLAIPGQNIVFVQAADQLGIAQITDRQQPLFVVHRLHLWRQQLTRLQGRRVTNKFMIFFGFRIGIHPHQTTTTRVAAEAGITGNEGQA